jgi:hypothetical protein
MSSPMPRTATLIRIAVAVYAVAWFVPVIDTSGSILHGTLPGWQAASSAAGASYEGHESNLVLTVLLRSTAWLNFAFVIAAAAGFFAGASARLLRQAAVAVFIAAALNVQWLIPVGTTSAADLYSALRIGFYMWFASYPLLALSLLRRASELSVPLPAART